MQINRFVFKLTEIEFRCKIGRNIWAKVKNSQEEKKIEEFCRFLN